MQVDQPARVYRVIPLGYRQELLGRDLEGGLHICCLGSVHDDLSPGEWLAEVDDDSLWAALGTVNSLFNPFSQLAALDVALYRQDDGRFQEFAKEAVEQLLHDNFGFGEETDVYRLLQIVGDFVLNRVNLLENGATKPGFWKRLGAWMQAGYIVETMLRSSYTGSLDKLEEWTRGVMRMAGAYASLIDAKTEPMLLVARMTKGRLRHEVLGRLELLKLRHEEKGHNVPASQQIDRILEGFESMGFRPALQFPGPLEGDRRPTTSLPPNIELEIDKLADAEDGDLLAFLVTLTEWFSLNERQLELARMVIEKTVEGIQEEGAEGALHSLDLASIVAAACRSTSLAAAIGDGIVRIAPFVSGNEVERIPSILLQAATAFQVEKEWFTWLDEKLLEVVGRLACAYPVQC